MNFEQWLQSRLTAHGYPVGAIDGVIGPVTIEALKDFQRSRGAEVTGRAAPTTVNFLRMPASAVLPEKLIGVPDRDIPAEREKHQPPRTVWPRQADCMSFFGPVGGRQTSIEVPFDMVLAWDKGTRVRKITLHEMVAESASRALEKIVRAYSEAERNSLGINLFGGSLNVRRMRGGSSYSMHSWGIAIDFDPERNQLNWGRERARLARPDAVPFWAAWESEGWVSLGQERNFDWMHVQAARL